MHASHRLHHELGNSFYVLRLVVLTELTVAFFQTALSPDIVADEVFKAVLSDQFYVLTHPEGSREQIEARLTAVLEQRAPAIVPEGQFPQR